MVAGWRFDLGACQRNLSRSCPGRVLHDQTVRASIAGNVCQEESGRREADRTYAQLCNTHVVAKALHGGAAGVDESGNPVASEGGSESSRVTSGIGMGTGFMS